MNSILFGNRYWGSIVKEKIKGLTNLLLVVDSKTDSKLIDKTLLSADIAFICSPTSTHYSIVKQCIDNNIKCIFCTKPFTGDYEKAKELFNIADSMGVNIFVDNLFLFRNEIIKFHLKDPKRISFYWMNQCIRENIFDSLLYHDLYLLLKWSASDRWRIKTSCIKDETLYLFMSNGYQSCAFNYNTGNRCKKKCIIIDSHVINLNYPQNDPLKECIIDMIEGNIDYDLSKKVTLDTLNLLSYIKNLLT